MSDHYGLDPVAMGYSLLALVIGSFAAGCFVTWLVMR